MPFLRFTKGDSPHDHRIWFRSVFFGDLDWRQGTSSQGLPMERAEITLRVTINGTEIGRRRMRLDHIPGRASNNSAPTTHLHYDRKTRQALESENLAGHQVIVTKYEGGDYALEMR